jgi:hypothetical protein
MEVAWGAAERTRCTPQKFVKLFYDRNPANSAEAAVHMRMKNCKGVPIYRVDPETKDNKGRGSRGRCVECTSLTNVYCISCRKWLCDPRLAAKRTDSSNNSGDPKYIKISFDDGMKRDSICGIFSCWHKSHHAALDFEGALNRDGQYSYDLDEISSMTSF